AIAEVLRGREARARATIVLGRDELPEAEVRVVAPHLAAPCEVPPDAATAFEALDERRRLDEQRVRAVAVRDDEHLLSGLRLRERAREQQRRQRRAGAADLAEEPVLHLGLRVEPELADDRAVRLRVGAVDRRLRDVGGL